MIEPTTASEPTPEQLAAPPEADLGAGGAAGDSNSASNETAQGACIRFARTGTLIAWGLLALGVVAGLARIAPLAIDGSASPGAWARAWAGFVFSILAYGLAGLATAAVARVTAAGLGEYLDRVAQVSAELLRLAARGVAHLDRIVDVLSQVHLAQPQSEEQSSDRGSRLDLVRRAIRAAQWEEARSLLDALAAEFPDDPRLVLLATELKQARKNAAQQQLAKLEAAREVNDPHGVLENYQAVAELLEADARAALARDLGKWFLALFHRRLSTAKIQPDFVQLASRFAEAFASTIEGASVRAALPTLRRSVGLCPRCGSAYGGVGDACPKCLQALSLRVDEPDAEAENRVP